MRRVPQSIKTTAGEVSGLCLSPALRIPDTAPLERLCAIDNECAIMLKQARELSRWQSSQVRGPWRCCKMFTNVRRHSPSKFAIVGVPRTLIVCGGVPSGEARADAGAVRPASRLHVVHVFLCMYSKYISSGSQHRVARFHGGLGYTAYVHGYLLNVRMNVGPLAVEQVCETPGNGADVRRRRLVTSSLERRSRRPVGLSAVGLRSRVPALSGSVLAHCPRKRCRVREGGRVAGMNQQCDALGTRPWFRDTIGIDVAPPASCERECEQIEAVRGPVALCQAAKFRVSPFNSTHSCCGDLWGVLERTVDTQEQSTSTYHCTSRNKCRPPGLRFVTSGESCVSSQNHDGSAPDVSLIPDGRQQRNSRR